jgi:hypothetical protein
MGNEPVKLVTLGGLTYNANLATGKDNGNGTFTISFKSGEKLTYPEQPKLRQLPEDEQTNGEMKPDPSRPGAMYNSGIFREVNPRVEQRIDSGLIYDDTHFNITDVMGATFSSSKKTVAQVVLTDCVDTKVDLAKNQSRWYGDHASVEGGHGNEVILDSEDSAIINAHNVSGEGTAAQDSYKEE